MTRYIIPLLLLLLVAACSNDSDPVADKSSFIRIYDNNKFSASYYPVDLKQTPDGGFLILGGKRAEDPNFTGTYVMKVDEYGAFVFDDETATDILNPIGLLESNSKYYFFGMNGVQNQLVEMDADGKMSTPISVAGTYPCAAGMDGTNFLLLSYDYVNKKSVISLLSPTGQPVKSKSFDIGAGEAFLDKVIIEHFRRSGTQLPFFVGKTSSGQYYFNGVLGYNLALVFTDLNADDPQGEVLGEKTNGGISNILPLSSGKFAIARFNSGDNYFAPNITLKTSGVSNSTDDVDLTGYSLPELTPNASVKIINATIASKDYVVYASDTRSRQIALFAYDKATSEFKGSHYLGFSNPFEVASIINTADGGLAVLGTTYVAGRFPRICLFKLSSEQLSKTFK